MLGDAIGARTGGALVSQSLISKYNDEEAWRVHGFVVAKRAS